jgi:hypothetical protein
MADYVGNRGQTLWNSFDMDCEGKTAGALAQRIEIIASDAEGDFFLDDAAALE